MEETKKSSVIGMQGLPRIVGQERTLHSKLCIDCKVLKSIDEFYRHPRMLDGHFNSCKDCRKAYERIRAEKGLTQEGVRRRYHTNPRYKEHAARQAKKWIEKYPDKAKAQQLVSTAIRSGRLQKQPCEVCGSTTRIHAHHDDYGKSLDVRWLCALHHMREHMEKM